MPDLQAQIVDHRHHPARSVASAEITVDIGLGQACVFQRAFGDLGMQLCGRFIRCMPGRMLVNTGEVSLALDTQVVLRWRCLFAKVFSPFGPALASGQQSNSPRSIPRHGMRTPPIEGTTGSCANTSQFLSYP